MSGASPSRNDPCPCGSGKKYKKRCVDRDRRAERAGPQTSLFGEPPAT